ncbi:O-antigen ligase family protein [Eubacterium xylanophilum]|uniref:O-antigen ligase family protein n=1 Tax=Eubacterium xylanophilum TaxID=39497 RepID=UPI0012EB8FBA|nr:O-antigen ligase family protein [Eubacterium xylanophilum]
MKKAKRKSNGRISIRKMIAIWGILLLYFAPSIIMYSEPFSYLYDFVKYIRCGICFGFIVLGASRSYLKINLVKYSLLLFFLSLFISSALGDLNIFSWINTTLSILGIYYIIEYYGKKDIYAFLYYAYLYFLVLLLINDFFMIVSPGELIIVKNQLGNQPFYFLTSKNTFAMFSFPLLLLSNLCYEIKIIRGIDLMMSVGLAIFPIIVVHSVTSLVCIVLFELALIFLSKKVERIFSAKFWKNLLIVLSIFQIAFTFIFRSKAVQYIIITLLKKDPTLSGRSLLFDSAHQLISNHFILGMGNGMDGYYYYTVSPEYETGGIMWAHNTSLDLLTQGGIILFILFYIVMFFSFSKIFKKKKRINRISLVIVCMLVAYTLMGFTERFEFRYDLHFLFAIASISWKIKASEDVPMKQGENIEFFPKKA